MGELDQAIDGFVSCRTNKITLRVEESNQEMEEHGVIFDKILKDSPEIKDDLSRMDELAGRLNSVIADETYKEGFKDGAKLMIKLMG